MKREQGEVASPLRFRCAVSAAVLALAALLILGPPGASAAVSFCTFGSGPGQCNEPEGVAVDRSSGHVYVADAQNNRINVFDEDGAFQFSFGSTGSGPLLDHPTRVAIDNDPASPAYRDIYVVDGTLRIQRFSPSGEFILSFGSGKVNSRFNPVAVGPAGTVYFGEEVSKVRRILRFTPTGALLGSSTLPSEPSEDSFNMEGVAIDSSGMVYVSRAGIGAIKKYELTEPTATLLASFDAGANTRSLAIDSSDHLFAAQLTMSPGRPHVITERDSSGNLVKRFGYGQVDANMIGVAVGATGELFGSVGENGVSTSKVIRIAQPPPGPLTCCATVNPGNTKTTLNVGINPEGKSTTYHVEYITTEDFEANGNSFSGPHPPTSTPESGSIGSDFDLHDTKIQFGCVKVEVPAQPSCLTPSTSYRYRLVATNTDGDDEVEGIFSTKAPLELGEVFATEVGTDSARLHAVANPLGVPATGYFEYVDDAGFQADLAEGGDGFANAIQVPDVEGGQGPIDLGEGEGNKEIARVLTLLASGTTYHYRFVAGDPFATVQSQANVFSVFPRPALPTRACPNEDFRTAASAPLPQCRAYEMVSPVDKNGNDIKVLVSGAGFPARLDQSSNDGERFTYSSSTAFGDALSAPWSSQYLATRSKEAGWTTHSLNPPRESVSLSNQYIVKLDAQYKLFDAELTSGWLVDDAEPTLDECAAPGFINLYRRNTISGDYEAMLPAAPSNPETLEGYVIEVQGASADGSRTVFRANARLSSEAAKVNGEIAYQLYEHVADEGCGELRLVSFLPNGKPNASNASAGTPAQPGENRNGTVAHAVSADGSRVFFSTSINPLVSQQLYVRINADQPQSPVGSGKCTDPEEGCTYAIAAGGEADFWTAATDGSKAIYSVGESLYEFNTDKALAGEPASTLITDGLNGGQGVAAASADLSRLYFVSTEVINGEGEAGKPNLYLRHAGTVLLVATLRTSEAGANALQGTEVGSSRMITNGVRATADGGQLAFVSTAPLTGYDNADATEGRPAQEVYLYDAGADDLSCISCNPSGARPEARAFTVDKDTLRVSAYMAAGESQHFAPRALSEDGNRLFFESFEALLPRDTNGKADVYEWLRASGKEACEEAGAELYVPSAGGCLSLISSGQSPQDSEFADASPDGHDVFIRTSSSLLPQDNGLVDIYDARIDGGFPQPAAPPAACEGEACQGPPAPPNDPTPASSAFEGAGNVAEEKVASCHKPKVRRKGRCVAKKASKAHKKQKRRTH